MRKSVVAAAALVGASALTGSAVLPGSAATAASETRTKRFVLTQAEERDVGRTAFVGSDTVRSKRTGEIVGYDAITGKFYPQQEKFVVQIALALKGGIIVGRVVGKGEAREFDGRILKGTGKYKGIEGTILGRFSSQNKVHLTLHYRS